MIDVGKKSVLGVLVDGVDYEAAVDRIIVAAREARAYGVSALAVHGVMTGAKDPNHRHRLNDLDLVTPDGQPVRWAMNWLHGIGLAERVYGPRLTLEVLERAADEGLPVYLYGSDDLVLATLKERLVERIPRLLIAGAEPSKFRALSPEERDDVVTRVRASGARLVLVGLGCPRQEVFVWEMRDALCMPLLAVGAAFDYHAGLTREPPQWIQDKGLQWLFRLLQDPRRLWRRYVLLNPDFVVRLVAQRMGLGQSEPGASLRPTTECRYG